MLAGTAQEQSGEDHRGDASCGAEYVHTSETIPGAEASTADVNDIAELHDEKHQPDVKNGGQIGMPLPAFTEEAYEGLARGDVEVPVGMSKAWYEAVEPPRQKHFAQLLSYFKTLDH